MDSEQIGGYKVQNLLQTGQASQVYEVVEITSLRHFAMKILLPEKVKDAEQRRLLFYEADVGKKLAHPNIIKILHVNKSPTQPYFVMEFFPSGSLRTKQQQAKNDPKMAEFLKVNCEKIVKQAATGLAYMNASGWIHRDVKPANILVNGLGEVRIIRLCHFLPPADRHGEVVCRPGKGPGHAFLYVARAKSVARFSILGRTCTALAPPFTNC